MSDGRRRVKAYLVVILLFVMTAYCIRGSAADTSLAAEAGGPYGGSECESQLFDGSASTGAELYRWNVDGVWTDWSDFPYLEYTFRDDFDGTITLEVQAGGLTANDTAMVAVLNAPPRVVSLNGPESAVAGSVMQVMLVFCDEDGREGLASLDTFEVEFSWGDGSSSSLSLPAGSMEAVGEHRYMSAGTYEVSVLLSDDDEGSASESLSVVVSAPLYSFAGLMEYLSGLGLPKGTLNSLTVKMSGAQSAFDAGQFEAASGKLGAFMNEVRAQRDKKIPASAADELLRLSAGLLGTFPA